MMRLELDVKTLNKVGSIHISRGNKKLSRKVGNFNLPACRTCPFQGICRDYCYAVKAEKWPFVTCSRWDNFWATRRVSFVDEMVAKITKMRLKVVRIHEAGDVYHPAYAENLAEIARRLPDVRFYLYTKSIPYAAPLRDLPNFTVIFSYGGKMDDLITQGSDNYARVVHSAADVQPGEHLCKARTPGTKESQKICGRTCTYCHGEGHQVRVCFLIHVKGKNWKANTQRPPSKASPSKSALATAPPAVSMAAAAAIPKVEGDDRGEQRMTDREVAETPVKRVNWHELAGADFEEKFEGLNRRLGERGFRTRFRIVRDEFGWDVVVDDGGKPELVETVEQAEDIVEELLSSG